MFQILMPWRCDKRKEKEIQQHLFCFSEFLHWTLCGLITFLGCCSGPTAKRGVGECGGGMQCAQIDVNVEDVTVCMSFSASYLLFRDVWWFYWVVGTSTHDSKHLCCSSLHQAVGLMWTTGVFDWFHYRISTNFVFQVRSCWLHFTPSSTIQLACYNVTMTLLPMK